MFDLATESLTVAELLRRHPSAARVLARHQIDFCCGGGKLLSIAATEAATTVGSLLAEISADELAAAARDRALGVPTSLLAEWHIRPLSELIDHIVTTHHRPLDNEFPRLLMLAQRVAASHGGPQHHGVLTHIAALIEDMREHMLKEEQILFPLILGGDARANMPLSGMIEEHELIGVLLAEMRQLTHDYAAPEHACGSWRALWQGLAALEADIHLHVHLENNILFRRIATELSPTEGR